MSKGARHVCGVCLFVFVALALAGLGVLALAANSQEKCRTDRPASVKIHGDLKKIERDLKSTQDSLDRIQKKIEAPPR